MEELLRGNRSLMAKERFPRAPLQESQMEKCGSAKNSIDFREGVLTED